FRDALLSEAPVIWAARGGYGASRTLFGMSDVPLRARPKWIVGFSDATVLMTLCARAGIVAVHGANVTTLPAWDPPARDELFAWLCGRQTTPVVLRGSQSHPQARAEGWLFAGNLTVLASLAGTGQLPDLRGAVLALEDIGEKPYRLDRCFNQLQQ